MHSNIAVATAWWENGAKPPLRWQVYFYGHVLIVLLLGVLAILDSRGYYLENWTTRGALSDASFS